MKPNLNTFSPPWENGSANRLRLPTFDKGASLVVIGAGAFGGWSALYLQRKGYKVTLVDAWGPGNTRSSSGDETRVIRSTYGKNEVYFSLNVRALQLWKENEERFRKKLFHNTGVLWFCYNEKTPIVDDSIPYTVQHQMPYEYITPKDMAIRFPLINSQDLHHAYLDPFGGYLNARLAMQCVLQAFLMEGGNYIQQQAKPVYSGQKIEHIALSDGNRLMADGYLFACGAWLRDLFPSVLSHSLTCTKQEVYYFGLPATNTLSFENLPVWIDVDGLDFYYGIPGNTHRGFKIGVDIRGEAFNPTTDERTLTPAVLARAREFIAHRFPALKDAPLIEHRVCPYENSSDGNFIFDMHPGIDNVLLLGGGSGHGFKHGPALGELVADVLAGVKTSPALFTLHHRTP